MIRNYILLAWRNLVRHPFYAGISILGLTLGLWVAFLVAGYVWNQWQVNKNLRAHDRQYLLHSKWKDPGQGLEITTMGPLAKTLAEEYPHLVESYYRFDGITSNVSYGEKVFREGLQVGDSSLISMFGFELKEGDAASALDGPYKVVMTAEAAQKYFGKETALGKRIRIESFSGTVRDFEVSAVLKPLPVNSVTQLVDDYANQLFISIESLDYFGRNMDWGNRYIPGYILLREGVRPQQLKDPIRQLLQKYLLPSVAADLEVQPVLLRESYLSANDNLVRKMLWLLSAIAGFILLMAGINFVNICISRASVRLREIGIRKTMGGRRSQLIFQFLSESILLSLLAACLAFFFYAGSYDIVSDIVKKPLPSLSELPFHIWIVWLALGLITGCFAGAYPAFYLSAIDTAKAVKGKWESMREKNRLRPILIGFQFMLAVMALAGAGIVSRQIDLFFNGQLGYNKEMILTAQVSRDWTSAGVTRMESIRNKLEAIPEVKAASLSYEIMDGRNAANLQVYRQGQDSTQALNTPFLSTDTRFAEVYAVPMAAGVFFSANEMPTDTLGAVINETQARLMGWTDVRDAVGAATRVHNDSRVYTIKGVTRDFQFGSMHQAQAGLLFLHVRSYALYRFFSFKLKEGNPASAIEKLQKRWAELMPGTAFEYEFMDQSLEHLYRNEIQLRKAAWLASFLAIVIVLLGLVGMISLSIQRRTREMGIRKVLGASWSVVTRLFLKEFLLVLIVASCIAIPISWWLMQQWLNDFARQITLQASFFMLAAGSLIGVCMLVIVLQTWRLGMRKPGEIVNRES